MKPALLRIIRLFGKTAAAPVVVVDPMEGARVVLPSVEQRKRLNRARDMGRMMADLRRLNGIQD